MSKAPAFQLYSNDFLVDTLDWTIEEMGIYTRLLFFQWTNGSIPDDPVRLARIAGCGTKKFIHNSNRPLTKFVPIGNGYLQNERLEKTRQEQSQYIEMQREKGKKRAEKMWEGHIATATKRLQPEVQPKDSSSSSSSSSIKNKRKRVYIHSQKISFGNILLTPEEHEKLKLKYNSHLDDVLNFINLKIESKGISEWRKQYKSDYATILVWDKKGYLPESNKISSRIKQKWM